MRPAPSTTTTASDSESRIALGNCSPPESLRFRGRNAISRRLPLEDGQEERRKQRTYLVRVGLAVHRETELGGRWQSLRGPAEMLAGHAHAGLVAVVREHRLEVLAHDRILLDQRRIGQPLAGAQVMDSLLQEPRAAIGVAADHDAVGARLVECL